MEIIYIILGSILALLGGFITQRYQFYLDRKKNEDKIIFEIYDLLYKYSKFAQTPEIKLLELTKEELKKLTQKELSFESERRKMKLKISALAVQFKGKEYKDIAIRLFKLMIMDKFKTEENWEILIRQLYNTINKELVVRLHNEQDEF